jgi:hypothetical protein
VLEHDTKKIAVRAEKKAKSNLMTLNDRHFGRFIASHHILPNALLLRVPTTRIDT